MAVDVEGDENVRMYAMPHSILRIWAHSPQMRAMSVALLDRGESAPWHGLTKSVADVTGPLVRCALIRNVHSTFDRLRCSTAAEGQGTEQACQCQWSACHTPDSILPQTPRHTQPSSPLRWSLLQGLPAQVPLNGAQSIVNVRCAYARAAIKLQVRRRG